MSSYKRPDSIVGWISEIDFQTSVGTGTDPITVVPAAQNDNGLLFYDAFGIVTEQFGGATQDQGILTFKDTQGSPATLGTITAADSGADAVNDIVPSTNVAARAASGAAIKQVSAGYGITATITQETSGASAAGKMKVVVLCLPFSTAAEVEV